MTDAHPSSIRFQPNSYILERCIRVSFTDRYDLGGTRFYFLSFFLTLYLRIFDVFFLDFVYLSDPSIDSWISLQMFSKGLLFIIAMELTTFLPTEY
jgi:hypothetical protein